MMVTTVVRTSRDTGKFYFRIHRVENVGKALQTRACYMVLTSTKK